jgi:TPR repeat protein
LSILCFLGQGGKRDLEAARAWALKAAQQGNSTGRGLLAYIYEAGQGVDKDFLEAYKWCLLAEALGENNADAEAVRKRLDPALNTSQKAEARKRADEWQKTYGPQ